MHVLASLLAAPVILAQAGPTGQVDYEILRGELRESLAPYFKALFSSARGEKSSLPAFDVEAARKPFRERAQQATGELRQALRIAEVTVVVSCKAPDYRSAVLALIQEVPPESRAWSFVPGLLQVMAGLREAPVVAFMDSFMEKGVPDVRQILLADRVRMTAHKGTPEQHRLAVAALQKAFPDSLEAKRAVEALTQTQAHAPA